MAIYTQYGRYVKAKLFKEALTSGGGVYVAFGMGNPEWDASSTSISTGTPGPAPFNEIITSSTGAWYDNTYRRSWLGTTSTVHDYYGGHGYTPKSSRIPVFPANWPVPSTKPVVFDVNPSGTVSLNDSACRSAYIYKSGSTYTIHFNGVEEDIFPPSSNQIRELSYFTEFYIRGKVLTSLATSTNGNMTGLLGMVKGDVQLVKDIGSTGTGAIDEFFYGDRYWKIINQDEDTEMPCHVLVSASIEPYQLTDDPNADLGVIGRQICIYHKKTLDDPVITTYKPESYFFNFGQYTGLQGSKVLNFTDSNPEFEFILNDYIRGNTRVLNQVDRYGYIVGF